MAVVDARTGEILRTITVEDLTDVEPEAVPWVDESAHLFGRKVVLTTESHAFVIDPETGAVLRAVPFGRHVPESRSLQDGRIAAQTYGQRKTRVLDLRTGRQRLQPGLVVGVDDDRQPDRHVQGDARTAGARRTSSSVTRAGVRSAGTSASTARSRTWRSSPGSRGGGRAGGGRGHPRCCDVDLLAHPGGTQRRGARHRAGGSWPWPAVDRRPGRDGRRLRPDGHARRAPDGRDGRGRRRRDHSGRPGGGHAVVRGGAQHRAHPRPGEGARPLRRAPAVHRLRVPDRAHRHHAGREAGPGRDLRVDRRLLHGDHRPRARRRVGHRHGRADDAPSTSPGSRSDSP